MRRRAPLLAGAAALAMYLANGRTIGSGDTIGPALVPVALLRHGTIDLSAYTAALAPPGMLPYYLRQRDGGAWPIYSPAPGMLVAPLYLPAVRWFGRVPRTPAEWVDAALRWQKYAAALITAISVGVFCDLLLALGASMTPVSLLTLAYGLGSQAWSISAQALWQHGPATLGLLLVARAALAFRRRATLGVAIGGGIALGLVAAVRPSALAVALPIAVWGGWRARRTAYRLGWGLPAVILGGGWVAYSRWLLGASLGMYRDAFGAPTFDALAGLLISPARGLIPYFPVVLLAIPGMLAAKRRGWTAALAAAALLHLLLVTLHPDWGGGHGFGPRYMAEVQPVLLLLALPWLDRRPRRTGVALALVGWSVFVQVVGAFRYPAGCWDDDPVQVESAPGRLWDWVDNPVSREVRRAFHPAAESRPLSSWSARYRAAGRMSLAPGATERLRVEVTNTGREAWPVTADASCGCIVHLSWHLRDARGRPVRYEGTRAALGRPVGPGTSVAVDLPVTAPIAPGEYRLDVTLVQERVGWFEDRGVRPAVVRLRVDEAVR